MNSWLSKIEMPLLLRELRELAASKRTYVVRFAYAATLFFVACAAFFGGFSGVGTGELGSGRQLFSLLVNVQIFGMMLLIPAMTAGVITIEKERDALGVLLLTTLGPFKIVLQKLLGRLIPAFSFLLLGLPLLAVAYSYGGVPDDMLQHSIWLLFLAALHIGLISLFCSVWSTTTTQALLQSWIFIALSYVILRPIWLPHMIGYLQPGGVAIAYVFHAITTLILFAASVACLNFRAFASSKNMVMIVFRMLDQFFNSANAVTGGVVLIRDSNKLPKMHPVAWRETARKSLGTFRYQFRVLVCLLIPILFVCQLVRLDMLNRASPVNVTLLISWCITLLLVIIHGASLISSERSRQTLDVLLATPITGASILHQKWVGLRRMLIVLFVPFATITFFKAWYANLTWQYIVFSLAGYVVLLPVVTWISVWIGLRMRSQIRAVMTSIAVCIVLAMIPFGLEQALGRSLPVAALNPVQFLTDVELQGAGSVWHIRHQWDGVVFVVVFAVVGFALRYACATGIDQRLGRVPANFQPDPNAKRPVIG